MKIKSIGSNMSELTIGGVNILFSYETPVAGIDMEGWFKTNQYYSKTTSRHINKYVGINCRTVTQEWINNIVK